MKHFLAASAMLFSLLAAAQFPNLPYNPDENSDGLIGVVDLQGLLANYGNAFASAVVSEDGESAIVYMGEMAYPFCTQSCTNLPGIWSLPSLEDLGLVWGEVYNTQEISHTWLTPATNSAVYSTDLLQYFYSGTGGSESTHFISQMNHPQREYRCYCAAKQLPRVEYSACEGSNIQECCTSKVAEGWYPLGNPSSAPQNNSPYYRWNQAFWRFSQ